MDCFKTVPGTAERWEINEENFAEQTEKKPPFCQTDSAGVHYRAVCPLCDNPIDIIGLYRRELPQDGKGPYGRHHKGSIYKLADYSEAAYLNCPYHDPRLRERKRRPKESPVSNALCKMLRERFDIIVGVLEQTIGVKISRGYAEALQACDDVLLIPAEDGRSFQVKAKPGKFLQLTFCLMHHKYTAKGEGLEETYQLRVYEKEKTLLDQTLHVDPDGVSRALIMREHADIGMLYMAKGILGHVTKMADKEGK